MSGPRGAWNCRCWARTSSPVGCSGSEIVGETDRESSSVRADTICRYLRTEFRCPAVRRSLCHLLALLPSVAIAVGLGIEELEFVGVDQVAEVLSAGLLVVPGFGALAAFDVDPGALVKVVADDLGPAAEGLDGEPLRVFLQFPAFVLPTFGGRDGKLRNGRSLSAVLNFRIAAQDMRSAELSACLYTP